MNKRTDQPDGLSSWLLVVCVSVCSNKIGGHFLVLDPMIIVRLFFRLDFGGQFVAQKNHQLPLLVTVKLWIGRRAVRWLISASSSKTNFTESTGRRRRHSLLVANKKKFNTSIKQLIGGGPIAMAWKRCKGHPRRRKRRRRTAREWSTLGANRGSRVWLATRGAPH